jgi:pimeloyl-ACP methyl ester carboxylesterase
MIRTVVLSAALALVTLAASAPGGARTGVTDPCREPGETAVQLKTSDGARVYGVAVGKGSTGVVLAHQAMSDHCEWMTFARELARRGMRALAIDLRDNGVSRGGAAGRYDRDVAAAVARLRADGAKRVELVGASMGATSVLVAAASITPAVDGVVSLSAPARYYALDALRAVKRSRVPVRFVVGTQDTPFALDARTLMRAAVAKDKAILRLATSAHGSSLLELPRAKTFVLRFLMH